jgi:hypothetical protein
MKRILAAQLIVPALIALSSCAGRMNKVMASWQGANFNNS